MINWLRRLLGNEPPPAPIDRGDPAVRERARQQIASEIERSFAEFDEMLHELEQGPKPTRRPRGRVQD